MSPETRTLDLPGMGTISNHLHLLTSDRRHLRVNAFRTLTGLSRSEMARALNLHRPRMYEDEITLERELKNRVITLVWATDLAYELLGKDKEKAPLWLMAPNSAFGGDSPFDVIMRGNGKHVIDFLLERSGRKAGAAF